MSPPSASISRTRCPFANPPIAGLHDMRPMASALIVSRRVEHPIRAAASAASQPACPPPTTMTSYSFGYSYGDPLIAPRSMFHVEHSVICYQYQLLAYTKRTKDRVEDLFRGDLPQQLREGPGRFPDVRRRELERESLLRGHRSAGQGRLRSLDRQPLPRAGQRCLWPGGGPPPPPPPPPRPRRRDDLPASPHPFPLHRVRGLPKPRGVDQGHRDTAYGDVGVKIIPRGSRGLRHDRSLLPRQAV